MKTNYKRKGLLFRFVIFIISLFYKKSKFIGLNNLSNEGCIIVSNHSKMYGPIHGQLYFPTKKLIWCDAPMLDKKAFISYAYKNFFNGKPNFFQKALVHIFAPLITYVFNNADTLPVYRDINIMKTYKMSMDTLNQGKNILILPESPEEYNEIVNNFNEYFVDVARLYYRSYKKQIKFVPSYYSKKLNIMIFGKAIEFNAENDIKQERKRICKYLMDEITTLAKTLKKHKVIPFNNVKKSQYKFSK